MADDDLHLMSGELLGGRWEIRKELARGAFGSVYKARDKQTEQSCAVKIEPMNASNCMLKVEVAILKDLRSNTIHACQLIGYGKDTPRLRYVVMTLLGRNLYSLRRKIPSRQFSGPAVCRLACQCLRALQARHSLGYVHRDVKPANFVMGRRETGASQTVHLVDFGLARYYWMNDHERQVRPPRPNAGFRGTVRYASLGAHCGQDMSRRDDLWSLFYVLIEFRLGALPWRNEADERKVKSMKKTGGTVGLTQGMERGFDAMGAMLTRLNYMRRAEVRSDDRRGAWDPTAVRIRQRQPVRLGRRSRMKSTRDSDDE